MIDYNSLKRDGQRVGFTLSKVHRSSDDSKVLFFGLIVSVGLACLRVKRNGQESMRNQFKTFRGDTLAPSQDQTFHWHQILEIRVNP
jgi:hypothetical protein